MQEDYTSVAKLLKTVARWNKSENMCLKRKIQSSPIRRDKFLVEVISKDEDSVLPEVTDKI